MKIKLVKIKNLKWNNYNNLKKNVIDLKKLIKCKV